MIDDQKKHGCRTSGIDNLSRLREEVGLLENLLGEQDGKGGGIFPDVSAIIGRMEKLVGEMEEMCRDRNRRMSILTKKLDRIRVRERELALARKEAEAANESKSAFMASTSHELRTPLTSVLGFAKIVKKRFHEVILPSLSMKEPRIQRATNQIKSNLDIIVSEGQRLTDLINDVLDVSRMEAGRMSWHMESVDVEALIRQAAAEAGPMLAEKQDISLELILPEDLPALAGDKNKLLQVIGNLLSNAVKFTDRGRITVKAQTADQEIVISVSDTGVGISSEYRESIFDKFIQIGDTLTGKPRGTGLGLTLCRKIVEHHGGTINLESQTGRGTTFSFTLPVKKYTREYLPPGIGKEMPPGIGKELSPDIGKELSPGIGKELSPDIGKEMPPGIDKEMPPDIGKELTPGIGKELTPGIGDDLSQTSPDILSPIKDISPIKEHLSVMPGDLSPVRTILVVDDEIHIRELLKQELESAGFQVLEAADGLEAIEAAKKKIPDLILLDVLMPMINGFDVAAVLKNDPLTSDIPIVILSIVQDEARGLRIGADKYFIKPIQMDNLLSEIKGLL
ncbi:MAG: response regulator [Desulfamplus sp.]|nr:response regulator [Desulfamplus sp.]